MISSFFLNKTVTLRRREAGGWKEKELSFVFLEDVLFRSLTFKT